MIVLSAFATSFPTANNDVQGLNVNALSIATGSLIGASFYNIGGNTITLGPGGLTKVTDRHKQRTATLPTPKRPGSPDTRSRVGLPGSTGLGSHGRWLVGR